MLYSKLITRFKDNALTCMNYRVGYLCESIAECRIALHTCSLYRNPRLLTNRSLCCDVVII